MDHKTIYAEIDLGEYDSAYAGLHLRVLQNPTRAMRWAYYQSAKNTGTDGWIEQMGLLLDCPADQVGEMIDGMDIEILHWLFIPHLDDDGKVIMPFVFNIWDRYVSERVKAFAGRLSRS